MRTLCFKDDGVYLDDERINFIVSLNINSNAEEQHNTSEVKIIYLDNEDLKDGRYEILKDEEGMFIEKVVEETVKVYGLDVRACDPFRYEFTNAIDDE